MNSSPLRAEASGSAAPRTILVADGGAPAAVPGHRDAFEMLDDLMVVVEALCPTWPRREICGPIHNMRL